MFRRLILVSVLATATAVHAQLPEPVARALQAAGIPQDAMGAIVLRGGMPLVSHNPDRPMQPASTMKLVTTMVGLDQLGPVFKARTELRTSADVVNGVLQGDLYLRGGADPDFNEDVLVHMLEKLRTQGIRKIQGDLVLDRQLFQPARTDIGVAPFDESPEAYYNIIPDALLLNMNLLRVDMTSTGSKLKLGMLPQLERVTIESDMTLIDADCASGRRLEAAGLHAQGAEDHRAPARHLPQELQQDHGDQRPGAQRLHRAPVPQHLGTPGRHLHRHRARSGAGVGVGHAPAGRARLPPTGRRAARH